MICKDQEETAARERERGGDSKGEGDNVEIQGHA